MLSTTAFLALAVQCAASIPSSTSLDVARVESGFHPYAIAEILPDSRGVISHFPTSLPEAIRLTRQLATQERRYSVGLMQITQHQFPPLRRHGQRPA
ncbi:Transglycosylase SLT domain [Raoultella terrigena]|uniref:Transglycosylase SLT domain n=1 Tax=Raoultella terrigena TaxID=577 RepID=A0A4U9CZ45_RAOTE|nr:Transglycosylase SLT domain [Raoultella terrigena]